MPFWSNNPRVMNIQSIPSYEPKHQAKGDINNCNLSHSNDMIGKLCEACRHLEKHGLIYRVSGELRKWWTNHRKGDRKQLKFKEGKSEDDKILKKALLKLTSRELELILKVNQ